MKHKFDVVIVGAGHAGLEAAHAAARVGVRVALVTMRTADIGTLSCNPAIGGVGKGHLVREIDALDGVMARWADAAGIQFRLLNRSKGPAVQGPRTQIDRDAYRRVAQAETLHSERISVLPGEVVDLLIDRSRAVGVVLADGGEVSGRAIILTTGTFLGGMIHIGDEATPSGRAGDPAALRLSRRLLDHGLRLGRLKTGTPPRLRANSIDWSRVARQHGDVEPTFLSMETDAAACPQMSCGVTATNLDTHELITQSLDQSALYGGHLSGKGPRYCPSIEDKIVRFADKASHTIYLEPEGAGSDLVYPNGISTSLPLDVQIPLVRSIAGLENAEIVRPGYAIEYDYADPQGLADDLSLIGIESLYLAGQINGTTGYEEAAIQGLIAGTNAALHCLDWLPILLDRATSYAGVLIDDLTSRGVSEPYRMFTSRAEYRLNLRCDNAEQRLSQLGREVGLVGDGKWEAIQRRQALRDHLRSNRKFNIDPSPREGDAARLANDADDLYAPYIERQRRDVERLRQDRMIPIPDGISFDLAGLTTDQKQKLGERRPRTLASAMSIEGMSPAAGLVLLATLTNNGGSRP